MKISDKGVVIENVKSIDNNSVMGEDYIVIWDNDNVPVHVHKTVVEKIAQIHNSNNVLSPFLDQKYYNN